MRRTSTTPNLPTSPMVSLRHQGRSISADMAARRQSPQSFKSELKALKKVSALLGEEYQKGMTIMGLTHYRKRLTKWLYFFMMGGLPLMVMNIELRLMPFDDSNLVCEILRSANVVFTLLALLLLRQHNKVQTDLLKLCKLPLDSAHNKFRMHMLMLMVGVMPPGLAGTIPNPPLEDRLHSDCLGVCMFARFIIVLQLMTSMMPASDPVLLGQTHRIEVPFLLPFSAPLFCSKGASLPASPTIAPNSARCAAAHLCSHSWPSNATRPTTPSSPPPPHTLALNCVPHGLQVRNTFQLRYFLHQRPLRLLCSYLMVCWLAFAYMLHVCERSLLPHEELTAVGRARGSPGSVAHGRCY